MTERIRARILTLPFLTILVFCTVSPNVLGQVIGDVFYAYSGTIEGYNTCPANTFRDIDSDGKTHYCWTCPKGYTRAVFIPVWEAGACQKSLTVNSYATKMAKSEGCPTDINPQLAKGIVGGDSYARFIATLVKTMCYTCPEPSEAQMGRLQEEYTVAFGGVQATAPYRCFWQLTKKQ